MVESCGVGTVVDAIEVGVSVVLACVGVMIESCGAGVRVASAFGVFGVMGEASAPLLSPQ